MNRIIKITCLFLILIFIILIPDIQARAKPPEITVMYFYSPTCSSCSQISNYLKTIEKKYEFIKTEKHNITDLKNKSLLNIYDKQYNVDEDKIGQVPIVFIKDKYLYGQEEIKSNIETIINDGRDISTFVLSAGNETDDYNNEMSIFIKFNWLKVFIAGLINGINPCSLSMLLFFITLIINRKSNLIKICIGFCTGKFIAFLLMGTVCFSLLKSIDYLPVQKSINIFFILLLLCLALLNLKDYFKARNEDYGKIIMQLPKNLRRFNHNFMKNSVEKFNDYRILILISLGVGAILALGEFLCTGQIYLSTIVTIIQRNPVLNLNAFLYLVLYSIAYIIPLIILTIVISKGKAVFEVSETIRIHLGKIKLINAITFIVIAIILAINIK